MNIEGKVLLRGVVGSTVHGLALEGSDDLDEAAIVLEPKAAVYGLKEFETTVYRTAAIREGKPDAKSQAGDLDLTVHGLQKFCRLAAKGNPSVLMLLYLPEYSVKAAAGDILLAGRLLFLSKKAGNAYLGYLTAQRMRLTGERGQKGVTRPDLVAKYGYDTKYAMHAIRLGMQGREYLATGRLSLPMKQSDRDLLMAIRRGEVEFASVVHRARQMEDELKQAMEASMLPDEPDYDGINEMLTTIYEGEWG